MCSPGLLKIPGVLKIAHLKTLRCAVCVQFQNLFVSFHEEWNFRRWINSILQVHFRRAMALTLKKQGLHVEQWKTMSHVIKVDNAQISRNNSKIMVNYKHVLQPFRFGCSFKNDAFL